MSWPEGWVRSALETRRGAGGAGAFSEISTDSRHLMPGALFVALSGPSFDGHDFLVPARDAGARAAVVRRGTAPVAGLELIEVDDPLAAYGRMGRARRRQITGPVVAVTGSNGKTSTKEMAAAVLRTRFATHATRANLNNLVGIPQTILAAPAGTEALVIEAGASELGEIPTARDIIEPTVAIITTVAASHLEGFGSLEAILGEKLGLARDVPLAIVGTDPPELARRARVEAGRVITAGLRDADVVPDGWRIDPLGQAEVRIDGESFRLPVRGEHQVANAMLAWALARQLRLDRGACARALESLVLPGGRGQLKTLRGLTILDDCYNANPQSFRAVLRTAQAMRAGRRLVFVAGTMRELGADSSRLHAEVARELVALEPELLAATGEFVEPLEDARPALGDRLLTAPDVPALGRALAPRLAGDELVVLKASRGVALERILEYLVTPADSAS